MLHQIEGADEFTESLEANRAEYERMGYDVDEMTRKSVPDPHFLEAEYIDWFAQLSSCRPPADGALCFINVNSMYEFAERLVKYGDIPHNYIKTFVRVIRAMDGAYVNHQNNKLKSKEAVNG